MKEFAQAPELALHYSPWENASLRRFLSLLADYPENRKLRRSVLRHGLIFTLHFIDLGYRCGIYDDVDHINRLIPAS